MRIANSWDYVALASVCDLEMEPRLPVSSNQCITGLHRYTELSNYVKITKKNVKGPLLVILMDL